MRRLAACLVTLSPCLAESVADDIPAGVDLGEDWDLVTEIAYDTGDGGWYGNLEATWSRPLGESSFLIATAGSSWTEDYYGSSGWNDLHARINWTHAFNKSVAVTPFAGTSIPMSSGPGSSRLFAGPWFEVTF